MPRKRNTTIFDAMALLPWCVTLLTGVGIWIYLKQQPGLGGGDVLKGTVLRLFLTAVQWLCFIAAAVSALAAVKRRRTFASAKDIESIRAMTWKEFETLIAETYRRQGFTVEETGGGGADGGVDLVLRGKGQKAIVQCKQWRQRQVGVKVVREMYGLMTHEKADRVVIVTSGTYTQEAQDFANGKPILLIDGQALAQHIREIKGTPADTAAPEPAAGNKSQRESSAQPQANPICPKCGSAMVLRTAKKGANAGGQFWGCQRYPACKGVANRPKEQEVADHVHLRCDASL